VLDFLLATQPKEQKKVKRHHGLRSRPDSSAGSRARRPGGERSTWRATASRTRAASSGWPTSGRPAG
jgi:hypothetical protein